MRLTSLRALQAKELVETAFNASGGLPVYLAGHSNGPLYALALLNSTTPQWRQQHIGEHWAGLDFCGNSSLVVVREKGHLPLCLATLLVRSVPSTETQEHWVGLILHALALLNTTMPQSRQHHIGEHLEDDLQMRGCSLR